jgi:hypothetical protein
VFERCVDLLGGLDNALTLLDGGDGDGEVVFLGIWSVKQNLHSLWCAVFIAYEKMTILYSGTL